jgi:DNA-binding CsgD family transcriptional regulator
VGRAPASYRAAVAPPADRPTALLERTEELASIDAVLADVLAREGRFAAIEGPAGIGKTSLLREARERASGAGVTVVSARGTELERPYSYGVVRQLFEATVSQGGDDGRGALLQGAAARAARLFDPGDLAAAPADEDGAFALLHGLYWLTLNLAERGPLLVAVDDLQWADEPSLRWLGYLARRLEGAPVGVIATVRPLEDEDPALAELLADPASTVIHPSALSPAAAAELTRAELGEHAAESFCLACHRTTGGNPLLLRELLRTLAAEGVAPDAAGVATVEAIAPEAVARSVRLRLQRSAPGARALARAVAVLGDGAEGSHAAALAGLEKRELAPAAALLSRLDLLRPEPPLRFVHPVVRNAVYETIPAHERAQEHARAAEVLAAAGASAEQVAAQLLLAPAESVADAAGPLRDAATRAAAEGAPASAAAYLRRALAEPLPDGDRADLLLELAAAELTLGEPRVVERLREAVGLTEGERRARAGLELGRALYWSRRAEEAVGALEAALAEPGLDEALRLRLEAELTMNAARIPSQHEEALRRLAAVEADAGAGPGARMLLVLKAYAAAAQGEGREQAAAWAEEAFAAMPKEERAWSYVGGLYALLFADRLEEGLRVIDGTLADARRRGAAFAVSGMLLMRTIFGYARGTLAEAEADARMALEALPHREALFMPHVHGWLIQVLVERGEPAEAVALLEALEADVGPFPEDFAHAPLLRARGVVAAARGDHATALADQLALGRVLAALSHHNPAVSSPGWRSEAALAHHALGDDEAALALAREEVELARAWGAPRPLGRALRVLGLVEGGAEGIERIAEAVALLDGSPARLEHAYALADLGAALRRANRRAEAREHLRAGLGLAQRCGAGRLARRAHEELIATGARPRRRELSGVESLTPSERRTAAMAAQGMSNKEIAQALFVTLRTVEMHLSNAFRKLDVSSRTQLPDVLGAENPAVDPSV